MTRVATLNLTQAEIRARLPMSVCIDLVADGYGTPNRLGPALDQSSRKRRLFTCFNTLPVAMSKSISRMRK